MIDRSRRVSFEEVADLYAETTLVYPEAWVDDILHLSAFPPGGRILEIGCGPGTATVLLARRGYAILAVELGRRMVELARQACQAFPGVTILHGLFEDWPVEEDAFDLALAADSIHWIPPEISYPKIAKALKPGGCLAVSAQAPVENAAKWVGEVDALYRELAPGLVNPENRFTTQWLIQTVKGKIDQSGLFGEVQIRQYTWTEVTSSDRYIKALRTFSGHYGMDSSLREQLYTRIRAVIDAQGGAVARPQRVVLFVARVHK
jgi:SAM-dependent methyltransferase